MSKGIKSSSRLKSVLKGNKLLTVVLISFIIFSYYPGLETYISSSEMHYLKYSKSLYKNLGGYRNILYDHPPLYFFLTSVPSNFFGIAGLRSVGILFGVLILLVVYLTARRVSGVKTALIVTTLLALNPFLIKMSRHAYVDVVFVFFMTVSIMCIIFGREKGGHFWGGIFSGLAILTKLQAVFSFPIYLYRYFKGKNANFKFLLPFAIGVILALLPLLGHLLDVINFQSSNVLRAWGDPFELLLPLLFNSAVLIGILIFLPFQKENISENNHFFYKVLLIWVLSFATIHLVLPHKESHYLFSTLIPLSLLTIPLIKKIKENMKLLSILIITSLILVSNSYSDWNYVTSEQLRPTIEGRNITKIRAFKKTFLGLDESLKLNTTVSENEDSEWMLVEKKTKVPPDYEIYKSFHYSWVGVYPIHFRNKISSEEGFSFSGNIYLIRRVK